MRVYVDMWNLLEYIIMLDVGCWMLDVGNNEEGGGGVFGRKRIWGLRCECLLFFSKKMENENEEEEFLRTNITKHTA
jgi:hypothetical protein